jgi:ketosteroid isomerase-like protein
MEAISEAQRRNIERAGRGFDAYNSRDYEALGRLLHPDVELHADDELLNGGDYRGHEGFMRWNAEWTEAWEEFTIEPRSVEALGDLWVLADVHQVARGAGSGVAVEMDVFWAFEIEADLVTRMHLFPVRERAVAAIERWRAARDEAP